MASGSRNIGGMDMRDARIEMSSNFLRFARAGNLEKMLELLDNGLVDIDTSNPNGLNALHLACKEGHVHIVNELLARHMPVDKPTKKGNTSLHIASMAGHENIIRILVQYGANVNAQSQNGFTPLYMAAQENNINVVKYLLNHGANQSIATEDGFTPLTVALQQEHNNVVKLLMESDPKGKVKLPALHAVAKKDDLQAATLLIQKEPLKDGLPAVNETTKSGFAPLHIAAHYGSAKVGKLLLQNGAEVNFKARNAITPLHVACKWGKSEMVDLLLDYDADIECKTRDSLTPLHCASRSGHLNVITVLLKRGSPIATKTKSGLTPLHMAAQGDHVDCAEYLLSRGANIDDVTVDFLTPLHVAAHCGNVRMAKFLLDDKCDPNARALNGFTPLHVACKKNRIKVIELLLKYGARVSDTTESGLTPLHVSSFMGYNNVVLYLLEHGATTEVPTIRGETALHLASRANQIEIMELLVRHGANVDAQAKEGQTPLHVSSRLGSLEGVELLLKQGASRDSTTKDLYTPLHIAVKEGHENIVKVLLEKGAKQNITTKKGFTPLHIVSKYGNLSIARLLLQKGADPNAEGKNGLTPLHVATHYNSVDVATLLLEKHSNVQSAAKNGYTPLHIAAKRNQVEIAQLLLKHGAKLNVESKNGYTPLHLASQEGNVDVAKLLLDKGAKVNCQSKNLLTPIHLAAQEDHVNVAQVLVDHKTTIDPQTKAGYTPLHTACHFGQLNMVRFLLQHGASVKNTTKMGYTPLHQAAQQGHVLVVQSLLAARANPDVLTADGQTPLSIAQQLGFISVVETLRPVTTTKVKTPSTQDKYRHFNPEIMQEAPIDSDDENDMTLLADKSYHYLNVDDTKDMRYNTSSPDDKGDLNDSRSGHHSTSSFRDSLRDNNDDTPHSTLERGFNKGNEGEGNVLKVPSLGIPPPTTTPTISTASPSAEDDVMYTVNGGLERGSSIAGEFVNLTAPANQNKMVVMKERKQEQPFLTTPTSKLTNGHPHHQPPPPIQPPPEVPTITRPDQLDHVPDYYMDCDTPLDGEFHHLARKYSGGLSPMKTFGGSAFSDVSNISNASFNPDNVSLDRHPICSGFLVSFVVDARGGAMSGCRHSGVRLVVPPCKVWQPTRITCKLVRREKVELVAPLPLNDGEGLATRVLQMGPVGIKFFGSVLIELPHYASLRNGERELVVFRSSDGRSWQEHSLAANEEDVQHALAGSNFNDEELEPAEKLYNRQVVRIVTNDFPRFFAIVTRFKLEPKVIGVEGGIISSKVTPQVQAIFPRNAIQNKNIKVSLQVMPVDGQLVHSICGDQVTASPIVSVEPRHRKFHEAITVTIPLPPQSGLKGSKGKPDPKVVNNLRLLYSLAGGTSPAKWEDITGSSPLTLTNDCVTFYTNISARFWLIEGPQLLPATSIKLATDLYREVVKVPYLTKFVVFSKRHSLTEARVRVFCMTDDKLEKTLESRQKFVEVARGRDVEVYEGTQQNLDIIGNITIIQQQQQQQTDQQQQQQPLEQQAPSNNYATDNRKQTIIFKPFRENRFQAMVRLIDIKADPTGQVLIIPSEPRLVRSRDGRCINPVCALNVALQRDFEPDPTPEEQDMRLLEILKNAVGAAADERFAKAEMRLTDIAGELQSDWVPLARQLKFSQQEIIDIQRDYTFVGEQALVVLHMWLERNGDQATGNELELALNKINRGDIVRKCMGNVQEVIEEWEKKEALEHLKTVEMKKIPWQTIEDGDNIDSNHVSLIAQSPEIIEKQRKDQEVINQFMKGSS